MSVVIFDPLSGVCHLRWISAFPGESEVLYPPLTYLRKTYEQEIRVPIPDENDEYVFRVIFVKPSFG